MCPGCSVRTELCSRIRFCRLASLGIFGFYEEFKLSRRWSRRRTKAIMIIHPSRVNTFQALKAPISGSADLCVKKVSSGV
jgi:hypothetical protein